MDMYKYKCNLKVALSVDGRKFHFFKFSGFASD